MPNVKTTGGAKFYLGPVSTAEPSSSFVALTPYTEVKEVTNLGRVGDAKGFVAYNPLGSNRTKQIPGSFNAGTLRLVCGRDPTDAGQIAMFAAVQTKNEYAIKIVLDDQITPTTGNATAIYYRAAIGGGDINLGGNEDVTTVTFDVALNSAPYIVPAV